VDDLLRAADLFVVSSVMEGMGTSTLDAMAAGLPVVATRVGGIPEIVTDGETGILVAPGDPSALAAALTRLASDAALRAALAGSGRRKARDFSADRTEEMTRRLYDELLARRGRPSGRRTGEAEGRIDPEKSTC
jgi:glycosyltransferase involved in cell wall biosynthesis